MGVGGSVVSVSAGSVVVSVAVIYGVVVSVSVVLTLPFPTPPLFLLLHLFLTRLVDYLLSDGPGNRYALICHHCQCHNGLALKEEFEFISQC